MDEPESIHISTFNEDKLAQADLEGSNDIIVQPIKGVCFTSDSPQTVRNAR